MIFDRHILRYYLRYAWMLLLGLVTLFAVDYMQLLIPNLYQKVINGINYGFVELEGGRVPFDRDFLLDQLCKPMLNILICMITGRFLWRVCIFGSAILVETDLRSRLFDHAKELSQEYYQKNKVGDLMSRFTNDLETVQDCFGEGFLMLFDALILGSMTFLKMWRMSRSLTLLILIPIALLIAVSTIVGKKMMDQWELRQAAFSKLSDFSQESFSGIAVIKAFVKETKELMAFRALGRENERANVNFAKTSVLLRILVMLFVESVICIIIGYGGWLVHEKVFNAGELMEFIGYFTAAVWPCMAVSELIDMTARGKASILRIGEILDAPIDVTDRAGVQPLVRPRGEIAFRDLTFRYPGADYDALRQISLCIQAGESIGIVGKTGAGKTTLVDLLLRTYRVPDGTVFFDGKDVNEIPIRDLRSACAYVPQDNFLFSDSIANNILFSDDKTGADAIRSAAILAELDETVRSFPDGYQTVLGERGVTVSGGQKQRIAIARALIRQAPVLILDDSLSAVDTVTERSILENLRRTRAGKTTILIAHRITTVESLDRIFFMEDGRLLAAGTHSALYESCRPYRRMVELQRLEEEGAAI